MSKYFEPYASRGMVILGVSLVVLNYILFMVSLFSGSYFGMFSSGVGFIFSHLAFHSAVESEKSFYDFLYGKGF